MLQKITTSLFFIAVAGLLVWQRFDVPEPLPVEIVRVQGSTVHEEGKRFRRGEFIKTEKGEFLELQIGSSIRLLMDEQTTIELKRLFEDDRKIGFTRGRLLIESNDKRPTTIDTHATRSEIKNGSATFVNYDFQNLVSVIPLGGSVALTIKNQNKTQTITAPTNILEFPEIKISLTTFDPTKEPSVKFYTWVDGK
jgi:ferric-dicitrate binding protein FerR (iron transport regulator)